MSGKRLVNKKTVLVSILTLCIIGTIAMYSLLGTTIRTGPPQREFPTLESVPRGYWEVLAGKRIFFGHQSVGNNIVDGLNEIIGEYEYIDLNIMESSEFVQGEQPCFAHGKVGENRKPLSKIEVFVDILNQNENADIDIALMKFCYIDIKHDSDVNSVFQTYSEAVAQLNDRHPAMRVVHVTTPLRSGYPGPRWKIDQSLKFLIGSPTLFDDNLQRHRYNELLRGEYEESGDFFDLALVESTTPQGQSCYTKRSKTKVPFLWMGYSADGGHLNELGKRKAAEQLLITLAKVANQSD